MDFEEVKSANDFYKSYNKIKGRILMALVCVTKINDSIFPKEIRYFCKEMNRIAVQKYKKYVSALTPIEHYNILYELLRRIDEEFGAEISKIKKDDVREYRNQHYFNMLNKDLIRSNILNLAPDQYEKEKKKLQDFLDQ